MTLRTIRMSRCTTSSNYDQCAIEQHDETHAIAGDTRPHHEFTMAACTPTTSLSRLADLDSDRTKPLVQLTVQIALSGVASCF